MAGRNSLREHRAAATRVLAAELGHDLQSGLSLFRLMVERLGQGHAPDAEELAALSEELGRFSELGARLRQLARTQLARDEHTPRALVEAACALSDASQLELEYEGEPGLTLSCDLDVLARGLAELLDNALEAKTTRAGVRVTCGTSVSFCVWDDGPGFEHDLQRSQRWGFSTRPAALGLGLTLALRAARAHGFNLQHAREGGRTLVTLVVPARDVHRRRDKVGA